ncbi:MAG TPA: carbohydrate-binding family 9-like protein [Polyangiaceae bacterium]
MRAFFWSALLALGLTSCSRKTPDFKADRERLQEHVLERLPEGVEKLEIDFDGKLKLVGYTVVPSRAARPGRPMEVVLYWQVLARVEPGYRLFTDLLDGSGERLVNLDTTGPLREIKEDRPALPPEAWEVGKIYADVMTFRFPRGVKTSRGLIVAGVERDQQRLPIRSGPKDSSERALIASVRIPVKRRRRRTTGVAVPTLECAKLRAGERIKIDGSLTEPAWQRATTLTLNDVSTGEPNGDSPVSATAKVTWSDLGLFIGFDVRDPDVVGGFPETGADPHLWTRDTVEIFVDPDGDGDNRDYYEIQINPQNLVFDSRFDDYNQPKQEPDGPFGHEAWMSRVTSAVVVRGTLDRPTDRDEGYVVEAVVPWASFDKAQRKPPAIGDTWRLNFYAVQNNHGVSWSPILNEGNFHKASRFGRVTFLSEGVTPHQSAEPATTKRR